MMRGFSIALILAGCLAAAPRLLAQSPPGGNQSAPGSSKPAPDAQKPPAAPPQSTANPFPEDTSSVPVLPSKGTPAGTFDQGEEGPAAGMASLPGVDTDPARSPDDPAPAAETEDSSSSLKGLDSLLPPPDSGDEPTKRKKLVVKEPTHQEAAAEDINVGSYYLDTKNWRAALSRYQSAMVLDPENPEVYWGLAEAERNLGQFANARQHYEKLLEYDPDGKHGKAARKAMKDPAIVAAQNPAPSQSTPPSPQ